MPKGKYKRSLKELERLQQQLLKIPNTHNKGKNNHFFGKRLFGKANPSWEGGKSFEQYPPSFSQQLKDRIRVRDNFICQDCGVPELECSRRLDIHHIDGNKKNCKEDNLKSLCMSCHLKERKNAKAGTKVS